MRNDIQRDDVLAILQRFKNSRGGSYGIRRIGVFGSVARGDPGPGGGLSRHPGRAGQRFEALFEQAEADQDGASEEAR